MSNPLQFSYESTPAAWRCYYNPEGPQGFGKTKDEALFDLWLSCDGDEETLMKAIVAALEALKSGDALNAARYQYIRDRMPRPETGQPIWMRRGDDLDEAIDAEMRAEGHKPGSDCQHPILTSSPTTANRCASCGALVPLPKQGTSEDTSHG